MPRLAGYIEGYYGRLLTWKERAFLVKRLHELKLTAFLYAPKEDPWQRHSWRIPYPRQWRTDFRLFVNYARSKRVRVIAALSPGLSFDYLSAADYRALRAKLRAFLDDGADDVALLMDDIPNRLPRNNKNRYRSLGEAHGRLASRLLDDLTSGRGSADLWFCPTVYCDQMAEGGAVGACRYLDDLAATLPAQAIVLWTGTHVISPLLNAHTLAPILQLFPGRLVIWDNLYANDYCPRSLFFGPYVGRGKELRAVTAGVMLNPTGLANTDALLLELLAGCMQGRDARRSWAAAIGSLDVAREIRAVAPFFAAPGSPAPKLSSTSLLPARRALQHLIWEWKSPLQREWYPFLYGLDLDLQALLGGKDREWIARKYPPSLRQLIKT